MDGSNRSRSTIHDTFARVSNGRFGLPAGFGRAGMKPGPAAIHSHAPYRDFRYSSIVSASETSKNPNTATT